MSDRFLNVQKALYTRLTSALTPVPVYDYVPQDEAPPFVVIGEDTALPADTKTYNGVEHSLQVHIYSDKRGLSEVKGYMATIYDDLQRAPLTVSGYNTSTPLFDFSDSFIEPEGSRGVIRFRVRTTE